MKIPVTLNRQKMIFEAQPDEPLMDVLRRNSCISVKCGCGKGFCGSCMVLLDGKPVASCRIPTAIVRDSEIETLESFSGTDEYRDIADGFARAGIRLCGYCDAGKIFTACGILRMHRIPSKKEITEEVRQLAPCCTDTETLVSGILFALAVHSRRTGRHLQDRHDMKSRVQENFR